MAFVRLQTPIQTGAEKRTPVRFIFLLLANEEHMVRVLQMATAFASIMLDEDFVAALRSCPSIATFCDLLVRELDCVTIVPSSHIPTSHLTDMAPGVAKPGDASAGASTRQIGRAHV